MSPLILFIFFIVAITSIIAIYAFNRIKEPIEFIKDENSLKGIKQKYWKNAEITNGRLAMIGLFAVIVNYGLFGWIIPGFF